MSDGSGTSFDAGYFTERSIYARFGDPAAAHRAVARWYRGLFALHRRRFGRRYPLRSPVLEVGCGHGGVVSLLAAEGLDCIALDVSHYIVGQARVLTGNRRLGVADGRAVPLRSSSVASVVALEVLEHVPRPEQVLGEVARVLRPGGTFLASTPNPGGDRLPLHDSGADPTHVSVLPPSTWGRLLGDAGFGEVEVHTVLLLPFAWKVWARASRAVPLPVVGPTSLLLARR